jgi:hypothetical protein
LKWRPPDVRPNAVSLARKSLKAFEGRDNRQMMREMLERLGKGVPESVGNKRRIALLRWAAALSNVAGHPMKVHPKTIGSVRETYIDLLALVNMGGVNVVTIAVELERRVRSL